jgi:type IV pilus assembly protein PilC
MSQHAFDSPRPARAGAALHKSLAAAPQPTLLRPANSAPELDAEDGPELFPRRISRTAVVYFTNQLAVMVDTGISLADALGHIAAQEPNLTLRRVVADLKDTVEEGQPFSAALARHPKLFNTTYCALVRAAEATGGMGTMLDRIARYLRQEVETRSKVRAALAYPAVMAVLAVAVTVFLLTYILPKFVPLFMRKGVQLPAPTRIMMGISAALTDYWYLWAASAAAVIGGLAYLRHTPQGRAALDRLRLALPVLGPLFLKIAVSRSIRTLGTMLQSGVPMLEALDLAGAVAANVYFERLWRSVADHVTQGGQVCEALARDPLFPRTLIQMVAAGEQTGKLGQVLERASAYYEQEVETAVKAATSLIEPLMIVFMGMVVGGIAMALLLPVFTLSRSAG